MSDTASLRIIDFLSRTIHVLHFLVLSKKAMKTLTAHLDAKPLSRDYLLSGVGRVACSEVPEWIEDAENIRSLDISAGELAQIDKSLWHYG